MKPSRLPRVAILPLLALLLVLFASADPAAGCSSCFTGDENSRRAYYETTLFLVAVPLCLVLGLGLWLRRAATRRGRRAVPLEQGEMR